MLNKSERPKFKEIIVHHTGGKSLHIYGDWDSTSLSRQYPRDKKGVEDPLLAHIATEWHKDSATVEAIDTNDRIWPDPRVPFDNIDDPI